MTTQINSRKSTVLQVAGANNNLLLFSFDFFFVFIAFLIISIINGVFDIVNFSVFVIIKLKASLLGFYLSIVLVIIFLSVLFIIALIIIAVTIDVIVVSIISVFVFITKLQLSELYCSISTLHRLHHLHHCYHRFYHHLIYQYYFYPQCKIFTSVFGSLTWQFMYLGLSPPQPSTIFL